MSPITSFSQIYNPRTDPTQFKYMNEFDLEQYAIVCSHEEVMQFLQEFGVTQSLWPLAQASFALVKLQTPDGYPKKCTECWVCYAAGVYYPVGRLLLRRII